MESGDKAQTASGTEASDYVTVAFPRSLINEVDYLVAEHPELGFQSRSEFLKHGARNLVAWAHDALLKRRELGLDASAPSEEPMKRFQEAQAGKKPIRRRGRGLR